MTQQKKELFTVYVGGPCSMKVITMTTSVGAAAIPRIIGLTDGRYVCGQIIELQHPERYVAVYGFADQCRSVRTEVFRVVAVLNFLIRSAGDVDVALLRLMEIQEQEEFTVPEAVNEIQALHETVQKHASQSKLQQRLLAKGAAQ